MARLPIELRLVEALEEAARGHGIDIVDVEVAGTSRAPRVCVRIDHADEGASTITLDEIGEQSGWIDAVVDEVDPFEGSFTLEVSSPGLDRPLRRERDFARFAGGRVALVTTAREGRRRYTGTLEGVEGGEVRVRCDDGTFSFALEEIDSCRIKPDYDALGRGGRPGKGSE